MSSVVSAAGSLQFISKVCWPCEWSHCVDSGPRRNGADLCGGLADCALRVGRGI